MKKKILLASANPYSFCTAVEQHLAKTLGPDAQVDGFNMYKTCARYAPYYRGGAGLIADFNRKYERFVAPHLSGADITAFVDVDRSGIPPLPANEAELRLYEINGAKVGLGALSSAVSVTTIRGAADLAEYGRTLEDAWRAAHLSYRAGEIVKQLGYDEIYIFNGRHCYTRPFCDVLETSARVLRYETASTLDSYIVADGSIHDAECFVDIVEKHDYDPADGEAFYAERLGKMPGNVATDLREQQVEGYVPAELAGQDFVAFFTSSDDEMYSVKDDHSFGEFETQMDIARALIPICREQGKKLVIRLHPHLRLKHHSWQRDWDFDLFAALGVMVIEPEDPCDTYALAQASHCVVTRGSTVGFECSYLGIPNAVVGDCPGGRMGASTITNNPAELDAFIADPKVLPNAKDSALVYGSFYKRGGHALPDFDVGAGLSNAKLNGRIVDPIRFVVHPIRAWLKSA